jgi:Asp-tRNA(Asn)/Glu-tRNA(Gln) amidotransferase C subunit
MRYAHKMNLQGIVSVSGKPGLWKALAQNKTGFILESLDEKKTKLVANLSTAKLAALDEITIFGYEDDIKLTDVLAKIKTSTSVPDAKADGTKLRQFFREVAPDHDEEKVYASDMKKIISWFNILKELPLFNEEPATAAAATPAPEEVVEEPAKPAAKKTKEAAPAAEPKAAKAPKKKKAE